MYKTLARLPLVCSRLIEEVMALTEGEEEWVEEEGGQEGIGGDLDSPNSVPPLTATESQAVEITAKAGIKFDRFTERFLIFRPHPRLQDRPETLVARQDAHSLLAQMQDRPTHTKKWAGIAICSRGYIEVLVRRAVPFALYRTLQHLRSDEPSCQHIGNQAFHTSSFDIEGAQSETPIHLVGRDACIEISSTSPACHTLASGSRFRARPNFSHSVKVSFGRPMEADELEDEAERLVNSLIYELDVRNNIKIFTAQWPVDNDFRRRRMRTQTLQSVRFPETEIEPAVSVLFGFAGRATENPPLAFLSYYQILESFYPMASRRSGIRELGLALADQRFNRHDKKHLMGILAIGENAANGTESEQLRTVLGEFVRSQSLVEFFSLSIWGKHFTKQGPIKGITDSINLENKQTPLAKQVAERVYRIRNRIVHAKDDPKYADVPALLPQSSEAESLGPDIELVRLLSYEVILAMQTPGN
ncbi:hypothetical protein G3I30_10135 [Actinospica acidiphila]|nr:hypothetical protein [Actinospica acidiphila]